MNDEGGRGVEKVREPHAPTLLAERQKVNVSSSVNLMREFSTACREELETLRTV